MRFSISNCQFTNLTTLKDSPRISYLIPRRKKGSKWNFWDIWSSKVDSNLDWTKIMPNSCRIIIAAKLWKLMRHALLMAFGVSSLSVRSDLRCKSWRKMLLAKHLMLIRHQTSRIVGLGRVQVWMNGDPEKQLMLRVPVVKQSEILMS